MVYAINVCNTWAFCTFPVFVPFTLVLELRLQVCVCGGGRRAGVAQVHESNPRTLHARRDLRANSA